jgi:RNA polymerase sigma-70 factor, ECF subfamily
MVNIFINGYRKKQREPILTLAEITEVESHAAAGSTSAVALSAEEEALSRLPAAEIADALRSLPTEFRLVVYLIDVEGFAYREAAAIMGIPLGTVMSRLHRGRTQLRALLTAPDQRRGLFETANQGERTGNRASGGSHVQRDNGSGHRAGGHCRRSTSCRHNDSPAPQPAAAFRA